MRPERQMLGQGLPLLHSGDTVCKHTLLQRESAKRRHEKKEDNSLHPTLHPLPLLHLDEKRKPKIPEDYRKLFFKGNSQFFWEIFALAVSSSLQASLIQISSWDIQYVHSFSDLNKNQNPQMLIETKDFCPNGAKNCHDDKIVKHRAKKTPIWKKHCHLNPSQ